jgi:hypothetical protein
MSYEGKAQPPVMCVHCTTAPAVAHIRVNMPGETWEADLCVNCQGEMHEILMKHGATVRREGKA